MNDKNNPGCIQLGFLSCLCSCGGCGPKNRIIPQTQEEEVSVTAEFYLSEDESEEETTEGSPGKLRQCGDGGGDG